MTPTPAGLPVPGAECDADGGCNSCSLGGATCGSGEGAHGGAMRSERAVVAAAGWVALSLALATGLVARVVWAVLPAVVTAVGAAALVVAGTTALRRSDALGDRAMRLGVSVLPWVVVGLLVSLATGLAAVLWGR